MLNIISSIAVSLIAFLLQVLLSYFRLRNVSYIDEVQFNGTKGLFTSFRNITPVALIIFSYSYSIHASGKFIATSMIVVFVTSMLLTIKFVGTSSERMLENYFLNLLFPFISIAGVFVVVRYFSNSFLLGFNFTFELSKLDSALIESGIYSFMIILMIFMMADLVYRALIRSRRFFWMLYNEIKIVVDVDESYTELNRIINDGEINDLIFKGKTTTIVATARGEQYKITCPNSAIKCYGHQIIQGGVR